MDRLLQPNTSLQETNPYSVSDRLLTKLVTIRW